MSSEKKKNSLFSVATWNKLTDLGIPFNQLRQESDHPSELIEYLYRSWRTGSLKVERNWNGNQEQPEIIEYSNSTCFLPDDQLFMLEMETGRSWKVATWNVNSIRTRLQLLLKWLDGIKPDVVCLQETKVENIQFPSWELRQAGYECVIYGQKSYNGVAILSKQPIEDLQTGFSNGYDPENARLICGTVNGIRLMNVYVPQGQTTSSDKFRYKLEFLEQLIEELQIQMKSGLPLAIMGDFNIAPDAKDVSDANVMQNQVSFHPLEHQLLSRITQLGLSDLFRKYDSQPRKYTWWDFRTQGFERGEGMRIDYILANSLIDSKSSNCFIDIETRALEKPSDHAPVIGEFHFT